MPVRLIEDLPFYDDARTIYIPDVPAPYIGHNQIIVWVSLTRRFAPYDADDPLPPGTRRFPALLHTGFNDTFLINERTLNEWALLDAGALLDLDFDPVVIRRRITKRPDVVSEPEADVSTLSLPYKAAWLWLHRPLPGIRDEMSQNPPARLFLPPGVVIVPKQFNEPRLPLLGMRTLRRNHLLVSINAGEGKVSIDKLP